MDLNYTRTASLSPYLHERGLPNIHSTLGYDPHPHPAPGHVPSDSYLPFQRQIPSSQHSFSRTSGLPATSPWGTENQHHTTDAHARERADTDNDRSLREASASASVSAVSTDENNLRGGT